MKATNTLAPSIHNKGIFFAVGIIILWASALLYSFTLNVSWLNPWNIVIILILTHLYTGLFITAHDAMHGTVSTSEKVNDIIGTICVSLYAAFSYKKLKYKHHNHHKNVATDHDPDFHGGSFFVWFFNFMKNYLTLWQFVILAIMHNVLNYVFKIPNINLVLFWIIPPILSSFQLFYFGTYLPHKNPEEITNPFKSRTQNINVVLGFISCYFFGYHYEHHSKPYLPWWKLWKEKI